MKAHYKVGSEPMHVTKTAGATTPHHLAPEPGHSGDGETMHLAPGHMGGGEPAGMGDAGGVGGGLGMATGADSAPDTSDPNEAGGGMGGAPPMGGGRGKRGY